MQDGVERISEPRIHSGTTPLAASEINTREFAGRIFVEVLMSTEGLCFDLSNFPVESCRTDTEDTSAAPYRKDSMPSASDDQVRNCQMVCRD
jgi:hypothetical protein